MCTMTAHVNFLNMLSKKLLDTLASMAMGTRQIQGKPGDSSIKTFQQNLLYVIKEWGEMHKFIDDSGIASKYFKVWDSIIRAKIKFPSSYIEPGEEPRQSIPNPVSESGTSKSKDLVKECIGLISCVIQTLEEMIKDPSLAVDINQQLVRRQKEIEDFANNNSETDPILFDLSPVLFELPELIKRALNNDKEAISQINEIGNTYAKENKEAPAKEEKDEEFDLDEPTKEEEKKPKEQEKIKESQLPIEWPDEEEKKAPPQKINYGDYRTEIHPPPPAAKSQPPLENDFFSNIPVASPSNNIWGGKPNALKEKPEDKKPALSNDLFEFDVPPPKKTQAVSQSTNFSSAPGNLEWEDVRK